LLTTPYGVTTAISRFDTQQDASVTTDTFLVYLPFIMRQFPCEISGYATLNNAPASVTLGLSQATPMNKATIATTTTGSDGKFCFNDVPVLASCDSNYGYAVYFGYGLEVPSREYVAGWGTNLLSRCAPTQVYTNIQAELSDLTILSPPEGITASVPITFSWTHPDVPSGYYALIFDTCSPITVGYTTTITFTELPVCIIPEKTSLWYIAETTLDSVRESQAHAIRFQSP
jgi:hypothetical protein